MNGILGNMQNWMTPDRADSLSALGLGLSQMSSGQAVNLAPMRLAMEQRKRRDAMKQSIAPALENLPPEMRSVLASMPPELASRYIMEHMMAKPAQSPIAGLEARALAAGLTPGSPEYQQFMLSGGGAPKPRRIITGADGYQYYEDGARVLPGVEAPKGSQSFIVSGEAAGEYGLKTDGTPYQVTVGPNGVEAKAVGSGGQNVTIENNLAPSTPGEEAFDKEMAKDLQQFALTGAADSSKNLSQLKAVREGLVTGDSGNVSGPGVGAFSRIPILGPTFAPGAVNAQEQIAEVVQRNLKEILGAQFTQKEGDNLIARAFNPNLDESVNVSRIDRLIRQMELAYQQKASASDYFMTHGTLKGWDGKLPSINDFDVLGDNPPGAGTRLKYNPATGEFE